MFTFGVQCPGAVDITDAEAFDWPRWVANVTQQRALVRDGVTHTFAVRWNQGERPELVLCRADNSFGSLCPVHQCYHETATRPSRVREGTDWRHHNVLVQATKISASWLRLKESAIKKRSRS